VCSFELWVKGLYSGESQACIRVAEAEAVHAACTVVLANISPTCHLNTLKEEASVETLCILPNMS